MTPVLSPNTQAILLLTAPLIVGRSGTEVELLTPSEYKRFARHLRELERQPADLLATDISELLMRCQPIVETERLKRLLGRGFLLSQAIERWQARAIWVVSRADAEYPRYLKARLREDAPAVIYGCGDITLLESGGLAIVGSRHADDALIHYTMSIGRLAAHSNRSIVSGGAKGIDQAAMKGALDAGGKVCGILADSLEKTVMNREHRNWLIEGRIVLISPFDPNAGFNVGNAMQRNKLIYALSDAALVVSSDLKKGGTWAGALEQLDKLRLVPVYVRSTGESQAGLDALKEKGALPWQNPQDEQAFETVFEKITPPAQQEQLSLEVAPAVSSKLNPEATLARTARDGLNPNPSDNTPEKMVMTAQAPSQTIGNEPVLTIANDDPSEVLFVEVRKLVKQILRVAKEEAEIAEALKVPKTLANAWLKRLKAEGVVGKQGRLYIKQPDLFG